MGPEPGLQIPAPSRTDFNKIKLTSSLARLFLLFLLGFSRIPLAFFRSQPPAWLLSFSFWALVSQFVN